MAEAVHPWSQRVRGFGSHLELRTIEFLQSLDYSNICQLCDVASLDTGPVCCRHVVCDRCYSAHDKYDSYGQKWCFKCPFDDAWSYTSRAKFGPTHNTLEEKMVQCLNAGSGCEFRGRLGDLDEHLRESCAMYFSLCSKCGSSVVHKDLRSHYITCQGAPVVFISATETQSVLDGIDKASKKLEQALASASPDSRNALESVAALVNEQFARIHRQIATSSNPSA